MSWKSNDDGSHYQRKSPKGKRISDSSGNTRSNGGRNLNSGMTNIDLEEMNMGEYELENLRLIENKEIRDDINDKMRKLDTLFTQNKMRNGILWSFLKDSINGQIEISLGENDKTHYTNRLSDFYIDDRVGFRNRKSVRELIDDIGHDLREIVKYDEANILIGDVVKPIRVTANVALKDIMEKNPNVEFNVVKMERGLDPSYIGYYIVESDKKPFQKNLIYAGSNDIEKTT